jgi:guanine nucleotide-binding protein G(i) subunit alpha
MDPASVVGLVGAVLGIADVVAKSVRTLLDMQSKFMTADVRVSTLIGQLSTLKAALGHIADMMSEEMSAAQYGQFFSDLDTALQGCEAMITALDTRLSALERNVDRLSISAKVQTIWDDSTLNEYLGILNNQIQALNLLLTALQWYVLGKWNWPN